MKNLPARWLSFAVLTLLLCLGVFAQTKPAANLQDQNLVGRLQFGDLDRLEATAKQVVDVSIDSRMIRFLAGMLSSKKPDQMRIKEALLDLKGIYVRSYQFDAPNGFTATDVDFIRRQIRTPLWTRIVGVRSQVKGENVEVYSMLEGDKMNGLAVIAAEPKSLTVVNIVGFIDLEKLQLLEGNFGLPKLKIEVNDNKDDAKDPAKKP
jgi:hypothetical protein